MKFINKRKLIIYTSILLIINGLAFLGIAFYFTLEDALMLCTGIFILSVELLFFSVAIYHISCFFIGKMKKQRSVYKQQKNQIKETWQNCHVKRGRKYE